MKLEWFAGIDWRSKTHQACVLDGAGKVLGERAFEHGGAGLSQMADWLLSFAAGDAGEVGVAIETPRGPVVESLMEHGFAVHSINPKQLDRFRDRFSPAGAKDDRRDARVLAAALRTDPHCLRRLVPTDPAIVELREWSRLSEELTRERVRLANRMRQQLWRYYPQFLDAVDDDVAAPWALDLWRSLPTPRAGQRVREVTLTRVLKQHRIRRVDAATLRARLRAPAVKVAAGSAEAAVAHVRLIAERLALVNRQLNDVRRELDRLVRQLAEATPADAADASTEDAPASSTEPPDAAISTATSVAPRGRLNPLTIPVLRRACHMPGSIDRSSRPRTEDDAKMQLAKWWGVHLAPGLRNAPTSSFFFVSTLMTGTLSAAQRSRSSVMCRNWSSRLGWEAPASFLWLTRSE